MPGPGEFRRGPASDRDRGDDDDDDGKGRSHERGAPVPTRVVPPSPFESHDATFLRALKSSSPANSAVVDAGADVEEGGGESRQTPSSSPRGRIAAFSGRSTIPPRSRAVLLVVAVAVNAAGRPLIDDDTSAADAVPAHSPRRRRRSSTSSSSAAAERTRRRRSLSIFRGGMSPTSLA